MKMVFKRQPNAIALRPGQEELLAWTNKFIETVKSNGELEAIHKKWLGTGLPDLSAP